MNVYVSHFLNGARPIKWQYMRTKFVIDGTKYVINGQLT